MHRLERIRIAGFKSIQDQTVELGPLNVLIGANGAGKSNFLGAFDLLHEIVIGELMLSVAKGGGANRLLYFGAKTTPQVLLDLDFGTKGYRCQLAHTVDDRLVFVDEQVKSDKTESLGTGHNETRLYGADWRRLGYFGDVIYFLETCQVYHFRDTTESAVVKLTGNIADNDYLRTDASNLAAFLYRLQETEPVAYRAISESISMVAPFFGGFNLRPDRLNPERIRLEWQEKGSKGYFDADALSDGTLRFIALATLLLQPKRPPLILIDEPELGLHPYAISVLADLFRSTANQTQLVVSTQSVTLVNQLSPEDVIVVDRVEKESVFRRLTSPEIATWLEDYALGDLWEKNVLGGRPGR